MIFSSFIYLLLFLPLAFAGYFYLNKKRLTYASRAYLVFASVFFYAFWKVDYLFLLLLSVLLNFTVGREISKNRKYKKFLLVFGIIVNIMPLAYYKYADFVLSNIACLFKLEIASLNLLLPLAISFFTFQQIAYLVDSYKGKTHEYDFINYFLFVSFFPQLIAGPIVHHKQMIPQFKSLSAKVFNFRNIAVGLFILIIGLFKKAVIADSLAPIANNGFEVAKNPDFFSSWFTSLAYTFQLYFDFSGYSDMAIGSALIFNIKLPKNFNSPYKAVSIQDFWRRWHMTLSAWLKDYIYIPLGGSRGTLAKTCFCLFITFIVGGIWHGAGWTFILWGALHGAAVVIHRFWQKIATMPKALARIVTFLFINFTWVFFRAATIPEAMKILKGMTFFNGISLPEKRRKSFAVLEKYGVDFKEWMADIVPEGEKYSYILNYVLVAMIISFVMKNTVDYVENKKSLTLIESILALILMLTAFNYMMINTSDFLYFNF